MGTKTQKLSNVVDQIVEWQSVVVADGSTNTNAVAGRGYFVDTSSGAHTINLPASPKIGDVVKVSLITAGNELTIGRNGNNINGSAADVTTSADGDMFELVYVNASEGWKITGQITAATFTEATGGTVTTSGNFKIHTFTGDGCFVVSNVGNGSSNPLGGPSTVDYLVVAGGGGGGIGCSGAGGGAGGFRESKDSTVNSPHTASPLAATTGITVSNTTYPVTVGAGGGGNAPVCSGPDGLFPISPTCNAKGCSGSNSVFSTITSTGGGGGGGQGGGGGLTGGSGGGGGHGSGTGGSGNTPPVSPPQGNPGAASAPGAGSAPSDAGGGGGGATSGASNCGAPGPTGHAGGAGATTSISGSPTAYAGGGGGTNRCGGGSNDTDGGVGGGGKGGYGPRPTPAPQGTGVSGTANTGGGGGGGKALTASPTCRPFGGSGSGGKGIVIIRYKFQ
jgi:hypothetical protein